MAELLLVQALALGLASVHWSPLDLAPPLVMGLVRVWVLVLAEVWAAALVLASAEASASALQKALA
jgi:hypothetical protein